MFTDALLTAAVLCMCCVAGDARYNGYKLIRFDADESVAEWLENLEDYAHDLDESVGEERRTLFDVWSEPTKIQRWADVIVSPDFLDTFALMMRKRGIEKFQVLKHNVQKQIDDETSAIDMKRRRRKRSIANNALDRFDEENYHKYDVMASFMRDLAREYPNLVHLINVSKSFEGRSIYGIKISTSSSYKPAIFIDAGVHAREWVAPAAALYVIKKLAQSYGHDARLTKAMQDYDWFIVPQVNPDGYEYSMTVDRLWRKTRSRNATVNKWCVGADANRNWGYRWGEAGANKSPCSNIYQGAFPFSEPEIIGLKNFMTWEIPDLKIYLSLHSYGQVFLSPWGYTNKRPENYNDQRNAARAAVTAMKKSTGALYSYGTISEVMYPASGTSIDYLQAKNIPYIYGVELRPQDNHESFGFNIPPQYIRPTGEEILSGVLAIAEYASAKKHTTAAAVAA